MGNRTHIAVENVSKEKCILYFKKYKPFRSLDFSEIDATAAEASEKAAMGTGNDEIVLPAKQEKTNPITRTDESRRRRRDLTEQLEEASETEDVASGEEDKIDGRAAKQSSIEAEEEQFPDAEGVSQILTIRTNKHTYKRTHTH